MYSDFFQFPAHLEAMSNQTEIEELKVQIRGWEKAFEAQSARKPTKQDAKNDPICMTNQYFSSLMLFSLTF